MRYCFIKKGKKGFDFAMTSSDFQNTNYSPLDKYNFQESGLQVISNGNIMIFYDRVYRLEMAYLKMLFEDCLKDKKTISVEELTYDIKPKIIETLQNIKRLFTNDKDDVKRWSMSGSIIFVTKEKLIMISSLFLVEEIAECINKKDLSLVVFDEILNNPSPEQLIKFMLEKAKEKNGDLEYPIVIGNSLKDDIKLIDINGNERIVKKEDYVCRW